MNLPKGQRKRNATGHILACTVAVAAVLCSLAAPAIVGAKTHKSVGAAQKSQKMHARVGQKTGHGKVHARQRGSVSEKEHAESRAALAGKTLAAERALRLNNAFILTSQLRPMAQQLASSRTPSSFAGVASFAQNHPGAGAATAYLALGHAYMLEKKFPDAVLAYRQASQPGDLLNDYAEYLGAQALLQQGHTAEVLPLLDRFAERHPESIFNVSAPLLLASAEVQQKDGASAVKVLETLRGTAAAERPDYKYALGLALQTTGDTAGAIAIYRSIFTLQSTTFEAGQAFTQLHALGATPSAAERKVRADLLFNAKRYAEASAEYAAIRNDASLTSADRDALEIYNAVCDLKLKHLSRKDAEKLPSTNDDTAALKMYLLAEISRTEKDRAGHDAIISQMVDRFPKSRWLEEALYSGGNMYLLTHDSTQALFHYKLLVEHFPNSVYAPSAHWRAAWLNYRLRRFAESARLMDEQIIRYGAGVEVSSALYWRARIYEESEHDLAQAANYYRALNANYTNFYYGVLARQKLTMLGDQAQVAPTPALASVRKVTVPDLASVVPEADPHYIKAKLLANAALNEYIAPEIAASPGATQWGALAQAQIYASYGEYTRALQSMKHSGVSFFAVPTAQVPDIYWKLLFPQPYWANLVQDAQRNGLDPYLVASLIRQESEFNAGAVSPAHAYGLMQLLPSVGKENAKKEGFKGFQPIELLNPAINLQLGTRNLRNVLGRFGGQPEYALAAYNAGDVPVRQWMSTGDYQDIAEFVEAIPYTETREYVQAIMRNREMYKSLYNLR